jgi:predicted Zn-ribbon and HTH transcriptional regulator
VSAEATQAVREVLEGADEPLSTDRIIAAVRNTAEPDEVQEALEHWHREIAAIEDASGKWLWVGPQ